jgi:hypothetical protein
MSQVPPHYAHLAKGGALPTYTTVLISYTQRYRSSGTVTVEVWRFL